MIWRSLFVVNAMLALIYLSQKSLFLIYPLLALYSLLGPRQSLQALSLLWIPGILSHVFFPVPYNHPLLIEDSTFFLLRWMVIAVAAGVGLVRLLMLRHYLIGSLKWVLWFSILCALSSIAMSAAVQISLLKIVSFLMGATAVLSGALLVSDSNERDELVSWLTIVFATLVVWNVALLPMDDSYRIHDGLFRGAFYHPQMTGIVSSLAFLWFLFELDRGYFNRVLTATLAVCSLAVLYNSGSRTAALAIVTGFIIAVSGAIFFSRAWRVDMIRLSNRYGLPAFVGVFVLCGLFLAPSVVEGISGFVTKREGETIFEIAPQTGRKEIVLVQLDNFTESPVFGHGFGVNVGSEAGGVAIDPVTGLPYSAPTEKGLLFSAILEEVGILGFVAFLIMMASLYLPILNGSSFLMGWIAVSAFMVNVGEATFFSFGGIGLLLWVVIGLVIRYSLANDGTQRLSPEVREVYSTSEG